MYGFIDHLITGEKEKRESDPAFYEQKISELKTSLFCLEIPFNVNKTLAYVISLVSQECSLETPLILSGSMVEQARYIWTALMVITQNSPQFDMKFFRNYVYNFKTEAELGWFSTFSKESLYEKKFKGNIQLEEIQKYLKEAEETVTYRNTMTSAKIKYIVNQLVLNAKNDDRINEANIVYECTSEPNLKEHPGNLVNFGIARGILLAITRDNISPENPITVYDEYTWTSLVLIGEFFPLKFDHHSIHFDRSMYSSKTATASLQDRDSLFSKEFDYLRQSLVESYLEDPQGLGLNIRQKDKRYKEEQERVAREKEKRKAEEEKRKAEEEKRKAEEEKRKAEEGKRKTEEKIRNVSHSLMVLCSQPEHEIKLSGIDDLLKIGADINYRESSSGETALFRALELGKERLAQYLIEKGADPFVQNYDGKSADSFISSSSPIYEIINKIKQEKELNKLPEQERYSVLLIQEVLSISCSLAKVRRLLSQGADVNYQDSDGYTPLMMATDKQNDALVEYLLKSGASPFIQNKYSEMASDLTSINSMIYKILKNHELLYSVLQANIQAVIALLMQGADINFQDLSNGYTPLLIAVEEGNTEMVIFLLQNGANIDLTTNTGQGVFELVENPDVLNLLESQIDQEYQDPSEESSESSSARSGFFNKG